jgi:anaerobic magnesium-protoporphyrin IX monomethyl ester cyclase
MRWYTRMGRRVWPHEIAGFLRDRLVGDGPTVSQFWGAAQDAEEESMSAVRPERRAGMQEAA